MAAWGIRSVRALAHEWRMTLARNNNYYYYNYYYSLARSRTTRSLAHSLTSLPTRSRKAEYIPMMMDERGKVVVGVCVCVWVCVCVRYSVV